MSIHLTLKEIREDKGISQKQASKGALSQSNYSKFENGLIDITYTSFIGVLENLDIVFEELMFIHNGYNFSEKEKIFRGFFHAPVNDINVLKHYKEVCGKYLESYDDSLIINILNICNACIISQETGEITYAHNIGKELLNEFSKKNHLFIRDIYLINSIFFVFPIETAHLTMSYIESSIEKYHDFKEINLLIINLRMNYILMLMKEKLEKDALLEIEKVLPLVKKYKIYLYLGIIYIRKGICLHNLKTPSETDFIEKGTTLLEILEEFQMLDFVQKEIEKYKR